MERGDPRKERWGDRGRNDADEQSGIIQRPRQPHKEQKQQRSTWGNIAAECRESVISSKVVLRSLQAGENWQFGALIPVAVDKGL